MADPLSTSVTTKRVGVSLFHPPSLPPSRRCVVYHYVTLGGSTDEILHDLEVMKTFEEVGLSLNNQKSEIICNDPVTRGTIISALPGARVVDPSGATLLGSPIGNTSCISISLKEKTHALEVMGDRLQYITAHDGILLLRNSFSIPKLLYVLRTPVSSLQISLPMMLYSNPLSAM